MNRRDEARTLLEALPRFATEGGKAFKPGFDRILALLDDLGNPHLASPTIHVAGTNGKGSTASFVAAIATASGLRTGLHTSPHLIDVTERMRLDGKPASKDWFADGLLAMKPAIERIGPSYFEVTLALSFAWFVEQRADLVVVETGLGGRLDATTVVDPVVCAITDIGMDHMDLLGDTLEAIAREKAGIMKFGVPTVVADSGPDVERALARAADEAGCPLHLARTEVTVETDRGLTIRTPVRTYTGVPIGLPGPVQVRNAALAVRVAELAASVDGLEAMQWPDAFRAGLADVTCLSGLRGRMETLFTRPLVMADVAHNAEGLAAALETLSGFAAAGRRIVMLSVMADKPVEAMLGHIAAFDSTVVPVHLDTARALPATRLAEIARGRGLACEPVLGDGPSSVREWIHTHALPDDSVLVAGSHLLVGPVLETWS